MSESAGGIADLVSQDPRLDRLVELFRSVGAPGDFHASGRDFAPMPRVSVGRIGTLSFPVPEQQIQALVAEAEPAPYGRGIETVVDPEVRNSFQIAPERVRISSPAWEEVFGDVLARTTSALGCAEGSLSAELYKLLVYEPGGFFLPHRDTEKAPGMVATLVIALPTAGAGGELVVRHRGREVVVPMQTDHPSELIHAAFYADCEHEIRPVTSGARVALVYNLIRRSQGALEAAPDRVALVVSLASELKKQFARSDGPEKLVWILEHEYSEAGLSFDTLKNVDAGVGRALLEAATLAGCSIHAALLEGSQTDHVMSYIDGDEIDDPLESDYEVALTEDWGFRLSGFRRPDAPSAALGQLDVEAGEMIPEGAIDPDEPSSRTLFEAMGNGGASVELLYKRAALVLWPWSDSMRVLAGAGAPAMDAFLARETGAGADPAALTQLAGSAASCWPDPPRWGSSDKRAWRAATGRAFDRIDRVGSREATEQFLERTVLPHYGEAMNEGLAAVAARRGPDALAGPLRTLIRARAADAGPSVIGLVEALARRVEDAETAEVWKGVLGELARDVLRGLARGKAALEPSPAGTHRRRSPLGAGDLAGICELGWRFDLDSTAADSIGTLLRGRAVLPAPERTGAEAVTRLWKQSPAKCGDSAAFRVLGEWVARFLLSRSSAPPDPPADWIVPSKGVGCSRCALCRELRHFCSDPEASEHRFVRIQADRKHLEQQIRGNADFRFRTLKRGRPYTLVVSKTRARHQKRLGEYADDVRDLGRILQVAEAFAGAEALSSEIAAAVERAEAPASG